MNVDRRNFLATGSAFLVAPYFTFLKSKNDKIIGYRDAKSFYEFYRFCYQNIKIPHHPKGARLFLTAKQIYFISQVVNNSYLIGEKDRQEGCSTAMAAYYTWLCVTKKNICCQVVSPNWSMNDCCREHYHFIAKNLTIETKVTSSSVNFCDNNSYIICKSSNDFVGCGGTHLFIDEAAYMDVRCLNFPLFAYAHGMRLSDKNVVIMSSLSSPICKSRKWFLRTLKDAKKGDNNFAVYKRFG
jgi:hypothetical protein